MSREQFDATLAEAIRQHPAAAHKGWKVDLSYFFNSLPCVALVKVRMTGDPAALIEVHGRLDPTDPGDGAEIAHELERIWVEEMVYRSAPEAHYLSVTDGAITLEAFTTTEYGYVSARVVVNRGSAAAA